MKPDEATLVKACLKHDQKACRQLYDTYAPQMFGICLRYARSREHAEDLLHDGFIKVFENLHKLHDTTHIAAWIRSVMIHNAVSSLRRERNLEAVTEITDDNNMFYSSDDIYAKIDVEVIMQAIQQLPTAYRMAFNLCEIEGYSYPEAAKHLGIGESTVRSNYFRARQILAQKLKGGFKNV